MDPDYIVVGGGSAGCVLAARLSEDPACRVALLEAGGEDTNPAVRQPNQWPLLWDAPENWGYATSLQVGYGLRTIPYPRGKVLGGTGAINAMVYVRGDAKDYDHWESMGNPGWSWRDVLPYFMKSEDQQHGASPVHGTGGPLSVQDQSAPSRMARAFVDAAEAAGHRRTADFNAGSPEGVGLFQATTRNGERCSTAMAFLQPARCRPNLSVITHARALRILMEGDRATGVEYFDGAQVLRLHAGQEVILCAGAIDSPRLLMLSGIGDAAHLQSHGLSVRVALPGVGAHLCDHPLTFVIFAPNVTERAPSASILAEGGMFMKSATMNDGFSADIQFFAIPFAPLQHGAMGRSRLSALAVQACRPRSRGRVSLRSSDPVDVPIIDPRFLTHPDDLALQIEGIRAARLIAAQEPLKSLLAKELMPGAGSVDDAALEQHVRATSGCIFHPVGTCRMGPGEDSVVDSQLRVHGVRGLRVADASVMPQITSGNTNAPTIMIAEKATSLILARH